MTQATNPIPLETANPFLSLNYEPAMESLGEDYFDFVEAAEFPQQILRFRNNDVLAQLGLDPINVTNQHFIEAFGHFESVRPFMALRYHGYQFGEYNPQLGDGRGFLYGQVRGVDGELYDFGTKGSGRTPYSRTADGRLTLKGGVREVLAAEMLHRMGVKTSRCLCLIETGEQLWRGDEPSPTRSSVMVRFSRSHIRFGTFERLHYFKRKDLIEKLLNHVIECYYPAIHNHADAQEKYGLFYAELVQRVAELTAQWMAAGFCHAVLNTDNMSITGESFDYGPYAFIPTYNPNFTAAYFDYYGRYSYSNQPGICRLNLEMLQRPLEAVIDPAAMEAGLAKFEEYYHQKYRQLMLNKLGFAEVPVDEAEELLKLTIQLLHKTQVGYHDFFIELKKQFSPDWRDDASLIFKEAEPAEVLNPWRQFYYHLLQQTSAAELDEMKGRLRQHNPEQVLLRPEIEAIWEPIVVEDNWEPFYALLKRIKSPD
ncbi:YdiU family protein [Microcoleus sp. FACHB-68]|uniref:protein adenylyltransferase SelO n=1 Tax=Microcoleus sp. FACHB-68 TaxID=2692826 RepID=UPI0016826041|nr:YdiU family protein [Microcoleus sp. FACHB-68]MBD1936803.1 YdiU family protein [Microcoleus sp. FACHB-68]